jgi:hypothetical protein
MDTEFFFSAGEATGAIIQHLSIADSIGREKFTFTLYGI